MKCGRTACDGEAQGWIHPVLHLEYCHNCAERIAQVNPGFVLLNRRELEQEICQIMSKMSAPQLVGLRNQLNGLVGQLDSVPSHLPTATANQNSDSL